MHLKTGYLDLAIAHTYYGIVVLNWILKNSRDGITQVLEIWLNSSTT